MAWARIHDSDSIRDKLVRKDTHTHNTHARTHTPAYHRRSFEPSAPSRWHTAGPFAPRIGVSAGTGSAKKIFRISQRQFGFDRKRTMSAPVMQVIGGEHLGNFFSPLSNPGFQILSAQAPHVSCTSASRVTSGQHSERIPHEQTRNADLGSARTGKLGQSRGRVTSRCHYC